MKSVNRKRDYNALFAEFLEVYRGRPIALNEGGMMIPHMFATWVLIRESTPEVVIESGIWRGQSTWLIEQATNADIISVDLEMGNRTYFSKRATYRDIDFAHLDLSALPKRKTLLFFDDHVNAFRRLMQGRAWGFENFIFEDNYPPGLGDTPSLKQMQLGAYDGNGPDRDTTGGGLNGFIKRQLRPRVAKWEVRAERYDAMILKSALATMEYDYEEFPPLRVFATTRWGTEWRATYGEIEGCLDTNRFDSETEALIEREGRGYTSLCNVRVVPSV